MTKKIIIGAVAAAIAVLAVWYFWPSSKQVNFTTKVINNDTIVTTVTATGSLAPVDQVEVGTQVSGEVKKIYVDYNSHVKKGQLLAELDKKTLQERLNQANASLQSALSSQTLAQQNYARTKALYDQKAATKADLETVQNALTQSKASVAQAQTNVREAKVNLSYAEIYSPIDGIVLGKEVEEGQTVASSFSTPTLFTIARDLKKMQVEADIDEADIGAVKKNQKVTFTVDSYTGQEFSGTVSQIRLSPKTTNNVVTYTVIITAPNPEEKLYPGMTANITIITESKAGVAVPVAATTFTPSDEVLQTLPRPKGRPNDKPVTADELKKEEGVTVPLNSKEKTVWLKKGDKVHPRRIYVGEGDGVNFIVTKGLELGDTVITNATVGQKEKAQKGGASNPLMPSRPKHEQKNSARDAQK